MINGDNENFSVPQSLISTSNLTASPSSMSCINSLDMTREVRPRHVCVCMRVCVCVSGAPACQLPVCSAQSGKKAKPNYRHTATDLAGMLTRTGGGEEGEEG